MSFYYYFTDRAGDFTVSHLFFKVKLVFFTLSNIIISEIIFKMHKGLYLIF